MSKQLSFLFTNLEGGGNITPMLQVVRKLTARGHHVRVMSDECNRRSAEAAGARFISWARAPNRKDRTPVSEILRDWARATPEEGMKSVVSDVMCGPALAYAQDTIDELKRERADLVVTFELVIGVLTGCEAVGQRAAILSPGFPILPVEGIPPIGPGLTPARNDEERAMHAEIAKAVEGLFDSDLATFNDARAALGLPPLAHLFEQRNAACVELAATARAFDFAPETLPGRFRYVGPQIGDPAWAKEWQSPWPDTDERPLVLVGFSTTFQNHARVLQNVIDALASLDARVLVTLGGSIEREALKPAANTVVVESAPHAAVMREASLVVNHGGHGTVIRSLANRVPQLVIPHGRDQNDSAARVAYRGAGLSLMPGASIEDIRAACARILTGPSFREAAKRLGEAVAEEAENSSVVQELEAAAADSLPSSAAA